jgi:hypothetical protein
VAAKTAAAAAERRQPECLCRTGSSATFGATQNTVGAAATLHARISGPLLGGGVIAADDAKQTGALAPWTRLQSISMSLEQPPMHA